MVAQRCYRSHVWCVVAHLAFDGPPGQCRAEACWSEGPEGAHDRKAWEKGDDHGLWHRRGIHQAEAALALVGAPSLACLSFALVACFASCVDLGGRCVTRKRRHFSSGSGRLRAQLAIQVQVQADFGRVCAAH